MDGRSKGERRRFGEDIIFVAGRQEGWAAAGSVAAGRLGGGNVPGLQLGGEEVGNGFVRCSGQRVDGRLGC
jgi:hypothetical protein